MNGFGNRSWLVVLPLLLAACDHESHLDPESAYNVHNVSKATVVEDKFWQIEHHEEATRPRLRHARSISLGYIGDAPLNNGVMRDDR